MGNRKPNHAFRARRPVVRPMVEILEDRTVLSTAYGLTANNVLILFDTATPTAIESSVTISGLQTGETIRGIDYRPETGALIGVGVVDTSGTDTGRLYSINPTTGVATQIGSTPFSTTLTDAASYGVDFNPQSGGLRVVNSGDQNLRLNAGTGALAGTDTNLAFTSGDTNAGDNPTVVAAAYDQNFHGTPTTTLFVIEAGNDVLARQGGVNGQAPPTNASPNAGELTTIGSLGVAIANNQVGFDTKINFNTGATVAYAAMTDDSDDLTKLYTINLGTGAATLVGNVGNGSQELIGLTLIPDGVEVVATDAGSAGVVAVYDAESGQQRFTITPYAGFTGGVRVASGDVNRDGVPDIITGAGPGGGPHVRVFSGIDGTPLAGAIGSFFAFDPAFAGGVYVASGDVTGDGFDDVIVSAGTGGGPQVRVFNGQTGAQVHDILAYQAGFLGGVRVAAGDVSGDGRADIITIAGPGGGPHVKAFDGVTGAEIRSFFAYSANFTGGGYVAAGDVNGDGLVEIITGPDAGGGPNVKVFSNAGTELKSFFAYDQSFTGGVRVGVADTNGDGRLDILTTPGRGRILPTVSFDGITLEQLDAFFAFGNSTDGSFVAGSR